MFEKTKQGSLAFVALLTFLALMVPAGVQAEDTPMKAVAEDGILVFQTDDGQFKWWWDARVYLDAAGYIEDEPEDENDRTESLSNGFMVRRARFAIKTQLWHDWYAEVDMDFAEESTELKDAYISYRGLFGGSGHVRIGNFRQPFGLEENFTSRNLLFLERSQGTDAFVVGRRMGLEFAKWEQNYRVAASVYGADVEDFEKPDDETFSFAARLNYAPIHTEESVMMLGASGTLRQTDFNTHKVRFKTKPETNVADIKYVDTGNILNVDTYNIFGGELAYKNKRFYAQSEYMMTNLSRKDFTENPAKPVAAENLTDLSFGGGYVYASYFLTEDTHPYDYASAEFGRVRPSSKNGAWELTARFSSVDMDDSDILAGASTSMTFGVNYYANANIRMYLNYGMVDNNENATGKDGTLAPNDDFSYVQMRFLAAF